MSTQSICDVCSKELRKRATFRTEAGVFDVLYDMTQADQKDICLYCAIDGLKKLDDRPLEGDGGWFGGDNTWMEGR